MWVQSQILRQWHEIRALQGSITTYIFCKTLPDFARDESSNNDFENCSEISAVNLPWHFAFSNFYVFHSTLLRMLQEGLNMVKYGFSSHTSLVCYGPSRWSRGRSLRMIICKRPVPSYYHLQEVGPFGLSFVRGPSIQMIICKRPVPWDDHLQEAGPFEWPFAGGRSLQMIICKRLVPLDDHLQVAGPSGSSLARGWSLRMIVFISSCCCCCWCRWAR